MQPTIGICDPDREGRTITRTTSHFRLGISLPSTPGWSTSQVFKGAKAFSTRFETYDLWVGRAAAAQQNPFNFPTSNKGKSSMLLSPDSSPRIGYPCFAPTHPPLQMHVSDPEEILSWGLGSFRVEKGDEYQKVPNYRRLLSQTHGNCLQNVRPWRPRHRLLVPALSARKRFAG